MDRSLIEDQIIAALKEALPGTPVESLPLGRQDERIRSIRKSAVWVVYMGAGYEDSKLLNMTVQRAELQWSIINMSKDYRGPLKAAESALEMMMAVQRAVLGFEPGGGDPFQLVRDSIVTFPQAGIMGYETIIKTSGHVRRT